MTASNRTSSYSTAAKPRSIRRVKRGWSDCFVWGCLVGLGSLVTGCRTPELLTDPVLGPSYKPANVHVADTQLPSSVRRVLILPVTAETSGNVAPQASETLAPILISELRKTQRFELSQPTAAQLLEWTGQSQWTAEQPLPKRFFETLREHTGCDAVMFCRVTQYKPYPPLIIGWSIKLYGTPDPKMIWAVDEVFDASAGPVSNGARRYQGATAPSRPALADSRSILISPSRFAQYTAETLAATMPAR